MKMVLSAGPSLSLLPGFSTSPDCLRQPIQVCPTLDSKYSAHYFITMRKLGHYYTQLWHWDLYRLCLCFCLKSLCYYLSSPANIVNAD